MPKAHNTIATTPKLTDAGNLTTGIIEPRRGIMVSNVINQWLILDASVYVSPTELVGLHTESAVSPGRESQQQSLRGKAPPLDCFSGSNLEITFDALLPSLERVAQWNQWTKEDTSIQLDDHLRGRTLQE